MKDDMGLREAAAVAWLKVIRELKDAGVKLQDEEMTYQIFRYGFAYGYGFGTDRSHEAFKAILEKL